MAWSRRYSDPTGRLQVPTLTMHTIGDNLVPVTGENQYGSKVARAGAGELLRQTYVSRAIHCNFTPAELVAGVLAVQQRVESGGWGSLATPEALNATAAGLGLGDSAFVAYQPGPMIGQEAPAQAPAGAPQARRACGERRDGRKRLGRERARRPI